MYIKIQFSFSIHISNVICLCIVGTVLLSNLFILFYLLF